MIKDNLQEVRGRIAAVCSRVGRSPDSVTIVCVSKGRNLDEIKEAIDAGLTLIGENKIQEALLKYNLLRAGSYEPGAIKWHMAGHLQTNKVKDAVRIFDLIHSVDSVHLADAINREAAKINKAQDILIEVKTSPEATKFGVKPEEVLKIAGELTKFKSINIKGFMTIAALVDNPQKARPYFKMLRELRDKIDKRMVLSMGMSDDFEVAIEEGADMVRLGRAIFE